MANWRQDLRYGIRGLHKHPTHTAVTLVTLVLAIAAITTVFSLIRQVVLRPLPMPAAEELYFVELESTETGDAERSESVPFATFRDWQSAVPESVDIAWAVIESSVLTEAEIGVYSAGHFVTDNFLSMIGTEPERGRWFTSEEAGQPVLVVSHDMWQQNLGGDESVVGRTISLDKQPFTVIGVMPQDFAKSLEPRIRYWRPVDGFGRGGAVIGRVRGDASPARLGQIALALDAVLERNMPGYRVRLVPLKDRLVGATALDLWLLMGAVAALFLVALLNVTNLTIARLGNRALELATRVSLGATRLRLIAQLISENVVLSLIAAAASILAAAWLLDVSLGIMGDAFPRREEVSLDLSTWSFALVAALVSGTLVALIASIGIANPERLIGRIQNAGGRLASSSGSVRLRRGLIASQVGVSLVLLVAVGLLARSYMKLLDEDIGFDPRQVVSGHVWRPEGLSDAEISRAFEGVLDAIAAVPSVERVAAGSTIPMGPIATRVDPAVEYAYRGQPELRDGEEARVALRTVTDDYFRVLGIPLAAGRFFDGREATSEAPAVIVNRALAERAWPDGSAVGRELILSRAGEPAPHTIVGVIENYRFEGPYADVKPEAFLSMTQTVFGGASYIAKVEGDPTTAMQSIAKIASSFDSAMPMIEVWSMDELVSGTVGDQRAVLSLLIGFAIFATLLAAVGIYGLTSYLIGFRRREIALRLALGASRGRIGLWVLGDAIVPAVAGATIGVAAALLSGRLLAGFLYGIDSWDWPAYASALIVILGVAVAAPLGPAARAARTSPSLALNSD